MHLNDFANEYWYPLLLQIVLKIVLRCKENDQFSVIERSFVKVWPYKIEVSQKVFLKSKNLTQAIKIDVQYRLLL